MTSSRSIGSTSNLASSAVVRRVAALLVALVALVGFARIADAKKRIAVLAFSGPKASGFQGQVTDILIHAKEVENLKRRLNEIYEKHTGQPFKAVEQALERDNFLTAEAAKEFGLIDKVIDKRPMPAEAK